MFQQQQLQPAMKKAKGAGGKAMTTAAAPMMNGGVVGEVRFDTKGATMKALNMMNGKPLNGSPLELQLDPSSKDGCKLIVGGIPEGIEWQELKDHFSAVGTVAFTNIKGGNRKGPRLVGEVRYDDPAVSQQAMALLNGTAMEGGGEITVTMDPRSKDGSKLIVTGIPPGTGWQELKDHFAQIGTPVAFAALKGADNHGGKGEVRYDNPEHAQIAVSTLNGSTLGGSQIAVALDHNSQDGSKLTVTGIPPHIEWQDLKDHFAQVGQVAFANVGEGKGKGKGKGGGGDMNPQMQQLMKAMMPEMMKAMMETMVSGGNMNQTMNMMQTLMSGMQGGGGKGGGKGWKSRW